MVKINGAQLTIVHGKTTEEWQNVFDGLLWGDMCEISGESMSNEDAMERSSATRIKIYLLKSSEALIIEGQVKSDVHNDGERVVCVDGRIRLHWRRRWSIKYIRRSEWRRRGSIERQRRRNRIRRTGRLRETRERGQSNMPVRRRHQNYNNRSNQTTTIHSMTSMTHVLHNNYSLLSTISISPLPNVSFAQLTTPFANRSSSSFVFPLCKHTLTLSLPLGTVGHVIGRTFMPRARRYAESGRGCGVSMGMIGDRFGCEVIR